MNKKNLITLIVATIVIGVSVYFVFSMLSPKPKTKTVQNSNEKKTVKEVPAKIDEKFYNTVSSLSDYGKPSLSGIGKSDLFADY